MKRTNLYYCPACHRVVMRKRKSETIKSDCTQSGKTETLTIVSSGDDLAFKMRVLFLGNQFDLSSFNEKERGLLESAFEQGAKVMYNSIVTATE